MALTKKHIAREIKADTGLTVEQANQTADTLLEILKSTLASGEEILISGFGKFKVNEKSARKGRNPQTGEKLMLKPRKVVKFYCSGKLRKKLNG